MSDISEQDALSQWHQARIPFAELLGFELTGIGAGRSQIRYVPQACHHNKFGIPHGGALMTLMDITMAAAASSTGENIGGVTIEMKTTFMRAAKGPLTAEGDVLRCTRSMAFVQARIVDESGELCAHATGTFKLVPNPQPSVSA